MSTAPPVLRPDVADLLRNLADTPDDPILTEMHQLAQERGFPIVGPEVGRLLAQLTQMLGARRIFEMGSGFGYSALWFARAMPADGQIYLCEGDAKNSALAQDFLTRADVADRAEFLTGDARELLPHTSGNFDIILCDVNKEQYPSAYEVMKDRVRVGGLIITDNLLWFGNVAAGMQDEKTAGVREYIRRMWANPQFLSSLMPVRDGVGISLRKS